ncbi:penicillin acylase family protein [Neolewinella aurantiaca]|uniref:Penicillin acylase family protein n=1 Tax=Neolewinella aurantiaca TaxID=2602767 RepID=A0A5C7FPV8_9BACT|nr:penicillin acylase family protein [Neolewinella aurantiaca]TXF88479.1 penicillin acylase family protein [Neolewinella aurantiaca]
MKYVHLATSGIVLLLWLIFGSYSGPAGLPVPALGNFFHPQKGFWHNSRPKLTDRTKKIGLNLDHPLAKGSVHFDDRGVPHVFAPDLESAAFMQGYVSAADRLWQMDISTRATEGRLSEVLGTRTLARDSMQIRRGFRQAAKNETDTMRVNFPEDMQVLEAYAAGVNAWIDQLKPRQYPVEYKILGHKPLRWSPYRTALLMKGMSQSLSSRYSDAGADKTKADLGEDVFNALFPSRFPADSPIVPDDGRYKKGAETQVQNQVSTALLSTQYAPATAHPKDYAIGASGYDAVSHEPYTLMPAHPDNGSNNWAVDAEHSNTRHPILASDPHLALSLPSIWYEIQISIPGVNARGVSLPGAPGIIMGFNDHIAYGETNVGHDVTDWFRIEWTDEKRTHYLLDGVKTPARIVTDTLHLKGSKPIIIQTPWTVFGPVPYYDGPYADHAMRYLGHDAPGKDVRPHTMAGTFLGLMQAENYDDYVHALKGYIDPAQNFIFAEKNGDIAIRPNGGFPIRAPGQTGRFTTPGNTITNAWRGYVPFSERPVHKNPARGFVSSANQTTTGPNYPYPYTGGFDEYRGRLINRYLSRETTMTQQTMKELQLSSHSLLAEELTPLLIARINRQALTDEGRELLRLISEWDYRCEGESRAATFFEMWRTKVYALTFDEMPSDSGYLQPELWKWNELLKKDARNAVFDIQATPNFKETAATLTQRAFDEIEEELAGELPVPWAEYRNTHVKHLGSIPGFGSELIRTGGARFAPRALSSGHGASWRMVVELGTQPRAWGTLPGGASGDPGSEFYDNCLSDWANGRYHELVRWKDDEEAKRKATGSWTFR